MLPDRRAPFDGWERADSIVINPHKWLFTPLDASLLLTRRMGTLRAAFSLVPEYLRTLDREAPVHDYNEYTPQLGRRFRALKLWVQLRWFGLEGLRRRIERHIELAAALAETIEADPDWELLAPVPFSTVCFRWRPAELADRADEPQIAERLDAANAAIMDAVNRTGEVFLSHTRLLGEFTIRVAVGNLRTEARHVERAWELLRAAAADQVVLA
jgi:aromatic-L-amino-acid decarboxylase